MRNLADEVYSEIKARIETSSIVFTEDPLKNFEILDRAMGTVNLLKGTLADLDNQVEGGITYLLYMLQKNKGVPFGICPEFKMWYNVNGSAKMCHEKGNAYKCGGNYGPNCNIQAQIELKRASQ